MKIGGGGRNSFAQSYWEAEVEVKDGFDKP